MANSKNVVSDCFSNQMFVLNCFGLLHNQNILRKVYAIGLLISLTIYCFSVFPEILKVYYVDLQKFINLISFEIGFLIALFCIYVAFWKRNELKQLFEQLQLLDELSKFKNSTVENDVIKQYKDVVKKQSYIGLSWAAFVQIICILMSVIISLNKEKWILPFGSGSAIINNDNVQFIVQIVIFYIPFTAIYVLLIIYINVLTLICAHCKLLQKYIALSGEVHKDLDMKYVEKKNPDWISYKVHLQHIVPYHVGIINVGSQMEKVFSLIIFILFGGITICLCLFIYHTQLNIQFPEILKDGICIISGYSILIIISSFGENVITESRKIASVCYNLDLVGSGLRIQKSVIIIMAISQRGIIPTIGKLKVLDLRTMLSILQSVYSYYTILRNVMNK